MWSISYPGYNLVNILTCILWTWNLSQSDCKKLFLKEGTVFLKSYNAAIQLVISCKQVIQFALYILWCQQLSNRVVRRLKVQSGSPYTSRQLMCERRVSEISNKPHTRCGGCTSVVCPRISLVKHVETTQHSISKNFLCKNM